jgi:hypothetical protein
MADVLMGKQVRCCACQKLFQAQADPPRPSPSISGGDVEDRPPSHPLPFCPGCGRRIPWDVLRCPFCREELEPELPSHVPPAPPSRLDWMPHRGRFLQVMGNITMAVGALTLCTFGIGALISVPMGITIWALAQHDLEEMRGGRMDPEGRPATENARTGGILGVVLGLLFGTFFAIVYLSHY